MAADGTITVSFTVADPQGLPLDVRGINTPGAIATSFVAAYIPRGGSDYVPMTSRRATVAVSGSIRQTGADTGGTLTQTAEGQYTYTFAAKAPAGFDPSTTFSVGIYSSRNLTEFDLGTNVANAVQTSGTDVHEVVNTQTCNKCHDPLQGARRRSARRAALRAVPQLGGQRHNTVDPDTGNSIDLKLMVHKIHMGSSLPSVGAGRPYQIIGFHNAVNDFSMVVFPAGRGWGAAFAVRVSADFSGQLDGGRRNRVPFGA